jgi:hypothetical protein
MMAVKDLLRAGSESCLEDLEVIPPFLLENDTGAKDELVARGAVHRSRRSKVKALVGYEQVVPRRVLPCRP